MPSFISILRVGTWTDAIADQEDVDFALAQAAGIQEADLHTERTLGEALQKLTLDVPGLRIAVRFETEEGDDYVLGYANGAWCEGRPEDAPPMDARRGTKRIAPDYAAYLAAAAEAERAIEVDDGAAMRSLLDDPRLAEPSPAATRNLEHRRMELHATRHRLWSALLAKPRDLPFDRVLRAFAEEVDSVDHIIAYKLYRQTHLMAPLAAHVPGPDARVERWVAQAIREWPDFPAAVPVAPAPVPRRRASGLDRLDGALAQLERAGATGLDPGLFRGFRWPSDTAELAEARAHAGPRLAALLAPSKPHGVRTAAIELLWALDVSPQELLPHLEGMVGSTVDAIRAAVAPPSAESPAVLVAPQRDLAEPVLGVVCDVSKMRDRSQAAMVLAECRALPAARRSAIDWLGDLAKAFPEATIAYADAKGVRVARGGAIDWGGERPPVAEVIAGDLRAQQPSETVADLPPRYVAFASHRAALERGIEQGDPAEKLWTMLADPVLTPKWGPLRTLGAAARTELYERLARAPRPVPIGLALSAVLREPTIGFRLVYALRSRLDLVPAFGGALYQATSPEVREVLREILGGAAERYEKRALPEVSLAAPVEASIRDAVGDALAREAASTLGAAGPKKRSPQEKAAFTEAEAQASEAARRGDLPSLLAALELPALAGERGNATRAALWRGGVLRVPRPSLSFARVLRALGEEVDEVAAGIAYKLYVQTHLQAALLEAAKEAFEREPGRLLARLCYAAREWPDFTVPEALPPELARRLRPR